VIKRSPTLKRFGSSLLRQWYGRIWYSLLTAGAF
jgi:hypothetical protein